ncbi:hypothetical protein LOCC1_G008579 [Lachnellula occidentalis]|uniref:DUF7730 domain-containing protein n=1 Tax=Lachnellula occidentalis TaxID=215460 RepID=A0A8H8U4V4_9HELO|nr:hypothetical protein LOCC1_G008579 [Lachnellula occidentalis]
MPPSQEGTPVKKKDIAEAIFNFDPSTASKIPEPRDRNRLIASKPPVDTTKGDNKVTLLTLPVEIRHRIYDLLLVSRFDREENPSSAVGNTDQKKILVHMVTARFRVYRTMEPAIVQTCKKIYHEANPILYSQNVFAISQPGQMFRLIEHIGLVNLKLIKTLDLWVPWMAEPSPWVQLLNVLAEEASGLRCIKLGWGSFSASGSGPPKEGCLGDNLDFVRALGKIQGLDTLVISGFCAKNWPAYLEERMGVRVQTVCSYCHKSHDFERGDLNDEEFKSEKRRLEKLNREMNEDELQQFIDYQKGTVHLIP